MSACTPKIKVQSCDGQTTEVDLDVIKQFTTIKILQNNVDPDWQSEPILLQKVNAATLKKVIDWCKYQKDDPPPMEEDEKMEKTDNIPPWDTEFLNVDQMTLFELIQAANELGIKGLLDVACKAEANILKGKTPEQIVQMLNVKIKNDLTKDESSSN